MVKTFKPQKLNDVKETTTARVARTSAELESENRVKDGKAPLTEMEKRQEAMRQEMIMNGYNVERDD